MYLLQDSVTQLYKKHRNTVLIPMVGASYLDYLEGQTVCHTKHFLYNPLSLHLLTLLGSSQDVSTYLCFHKHTCSLDSHLKGCCQLRAKLFLNLHVVPLINFLSDSISYFTNPCFSYIPILQNTQIAPSTNAKCIKRKRFKLNK